MGIVLGFSPPPPQASKINSASIASVVRSALLHLDESLGHLHSLINVCAPGPVREALERQFSAIQVAMQLARAKVETDMPLVAVAQK